MQVAKKVTLRHIKVPEAVRSEYEHVLSIFDRLSVNYVLIKYPYLVPRHANDLDILTSDESYSQCARVLRGEGYYAVYTEQNGEKYKTVFKKYIPELGFATFHLHREVAWNSVKVLSKEQILSRRVLIDDLKVPSPEDTLVITIAHILFETGEVRENEYKIVKALIGSYQLDQNYIKGVLDEFGWRKSFYRLLGMITEAKVELLPCSTGYLFRISALFRRLLCYQPVCSTTMYAHYTWKRLTKKVNISRRGVVVALIGCDGVGKSTVANELVKTCKEMLGPTFEPIYVGWNAAVLPTSLLLKHIVKWKKTKQSSKHNSLRKQKHRLVLNELVLLIYIMEYLAQWIFKIIPKTTQRVNVVCDRYFYDLSIYYKELDESIIGRLLFKLLPEPDFVFLLDCSCNTIAKRTSEYSLSELRELRDRYLELGAKIKSIKVISVEGAIPSIVHNILGYLWKHTDKHRHYFWHPIR